MGRTRSTVTLMSEKGIPQYTGTAVTGGTNSERATESIDLPLVMSKESAQNGAPRAGTPAVVLLSGGLDSTTVLAIAMDLGYDCHTISFDYGQRHRHELAASADIARSMCVASHRVFPIDIGSFGGSALTSDIEVPKDRDESQMNDIPVTYVPARNLVFLSIATALGETLGATDLFIGVNAVDYSGYPDCRPEFVDSFARTATLATKIGVELGVGLGVEGSGVRVHSPLMEMSKGEIITRGMELGVEYAGTHSCYDPVNTGSVWGACGRCDSCVLRRRGFEQAGVADPTVYA